MQEEDAVALLRRDGGTVVAWQGPGACSNGLLLLELLAWLAVPGRGLRWQVCCTRLPAGPEVHPPQMGLC